MTVRTTISKSAEMKINRYVYLHALQIYQNKPKRDNQQGKIKGKKYKGDVGPLEFTYNNFTRTHTAGVHAIYGN